MFKLSPKGNALAGLLLSVTLLGACATTSKPDSVADAAAANKLPTLGQSVGGSLSKIDTSVLTARTDGDTFRPGDTANVAIYGFEDLSDSFLVNREGNINFPLIGRVLVAGMSTLDLQETLSQKYGSTYLQNPNINVTIDSQVLGSIVVDGAVQGPGVFEINDYVSVTKAVAMAKGLKDEAIVDDLVVIRSVNGERTIYTVNLNAIQTQGAHDPSVMPGDYIFVKTEEDDDETLYGELLKSSPILNLLALVALR